MKYGLNIPNFGAGMTALLLSKLAHEAEEAGWDGFFIWDHILYKKNLRVPVLDPWITLAAIAMTTKHICIGAALTPIARRRPSKLARETATLDHLCNGRLIFMVGLGYPPDADFAFFGDDPDPKVRAKKLDEGLDILTGLWQGKPFNYQGEYHQVQESLFLPPVVQSPRIPIWVGGNWPNKAPFRRAARWDGVFPLKKEGSITKQDMVDIQHYVQQHRTVNTPFDVVVKGVTPGNDLAKTREIISPFQSVGVTWWLEALFDKRDSFEAMRKRVRQGPPRL